MAVSDSSLDEKWGKKKKPPRPRPGPKALGSRDMPGKGGLRKAPVQDLRPKEKDGGLTQLERNKIGLVQAAAKARGEGLFNGVFNPRYTRVIGKVERVVDGDTIIVNGVTIRMFGVNTPELNLHKPIPAEPGAVDAAQYTEDHLLGQTVVLEIDLANEKDSAGRTIATVMLEDGTSFEDMLLAAGHSQPYDFQALQQERWAAEDESLASKADSYFKQQATLARSDRDVPKWKVLALEKKFTDQTGNVDKQALKAEVESYKDEREKWLIIDYLNTVGYWIGAEYRNAWFYVKTTGWAAERSRPVAEEGYTWNAVSGARWGRATTADKLSVTDTFTVTELVRAIQGKEIAQLGEVAGKANTSGFWEDLIINIATDPASWINIYGRGLSLVWRGAKLIPGAEQVMIRGETYNIMIKSKVVDILNSASGRGRIKNKIAEQWAKFDKVKYPDLNEILGIRKKINDLYTEGTFKSKFPEGEYLAQVAYIERLRETLYKLGYSDDYMHAMDPENTAIMAGIPGASRETNKILNQEIKDVLLQIDNDIRKSIFDNIEQLEKDIARIVNIHNEKNWKEVRIEGVDILDELEADVPESWKKLKDLLSEPRDHIDPDKMRAWIEGVVEEIYANAPDEEIAARKVQAFLLKLEKWPIIAAQKKVEFLKTQRRILELEHQRYEETLLIIQANKELTKKLEPVEARLRNLEEKLDEAQKSQEQNLIMIKALKTEYKDYFKTGWGRKLDWASLQWRRAQTVIFPAYLAINIMGDLWHSFLAGLTDPRRYAKTNEILKYTNDPIWKLINKIKYFGKLSPEEEYTLWNLARTKEAKEKAKLWETFYSDLFVPTKGSMGYSIDTGMFAGYSISKIGGVSVKLYDDASPAMQSAVKVSLDDPGIQTLLKDLDIREVEFNSNFNPNPDIQADFNSLTRVIRLKPKLADQPGLIRHELAHAKIEELLNNVATQGTYKELMNKAGKTTYNKYTKDYLAVEKSALELIERVRVDRAAREHEYDAWAWSEGLRPDLEKLEPDIYNVRVDQFYADIFPEVMDKHLRYWREEVLAESLFNDVDLFPEYAGLYQNLGRSMPVTILQKTVLTVKNKKGQIVEYTGPQIKELLEFHRIIGTSGGIDVLQATGPESKADAFWRPFTDFVVAENNRVRTALFIDRLTKGDSPAEAAVYTKKFLFDYSPEALSDFEREYLNRLIPFYRWPRYAIPLTAEQIFENQGKFAAITKVYNAGLGSPYGQVAQDHLPDYAKGRLLIPVPDTASSYWVMNMPWDQVTMLPQEYDNKDPTEVFLGSHTYPWFHMPVEMSENRDFFTGKRVSDNPSGYVEANVFGRGISSLAYAQGNDKWWEKFSRLILGMVVLTASDYYIEDWKKGATEKKMYHRVIAKLVGTWHGCGI